MSIRTEIVCNGCGKVGATSNHGNPAHFLRSELKRNCGWYHKNKHDFCRTCAKQLFPGRKTP